MSSKSDVIFHKYGSDVTIMTSSTQNKLKINLHAKFGVSKTFGL